MKLSDIKGERVFDVIADIIDPIANIAADDEAANLFKRKPLPKAVDARKFTINRMRASVPKLIKSHKDDVVSILAIMEGISAEEYVKELNMLNLISDFADLITDDGILALFTSAQTENSSGSAQENTEEPEA